MQNLSRCPECEKSISSRAWGCRCGWRMNREKIIDANFQCGFYFKNKRCRLVGRISTSTKGGGVWYCRAHWLARDDKIKSIKILENVENNIYSENISEKDWREKVIESILPSHLHVTRESVLARIPKAVLKMKAKIEGKRND